MKRRKDEKKEGRKKELETKTRTRRVWTLVWRETCKVTQRRGAKLKLSLSFFFRQRVSSFLVSASSRHPLTAMTPALFSSTSTKGSACGALLLLLLRRAAVRRVGKALTDSRLARSSSTPTTLFGSDTGDDNDGEAPAPTAAKSFTASTAASAFACVRAVTTTCLVATTTTTTTTKGVRKILFSC